MAKLRKTVESELKKLKEFEEHYNNSSEQYLKELKELESKETKLKAKKASNKIMIYFMKESVPYALLILVSFLYTLIQYKNHMGVLIGIISVVSIYLLVVLITYIKDKSRTEKLNKEITHTEAEIRAKNTKLFEIYKKTNQCVPLRYIDKVDKIREILENKKVDTIDKAVKLLDTENI